MNPDAYHSGGAIFWVEVNKIKPNPYQPRTEFDETRLNDLAESVRQYGVLQPLVVTRREIIRDDGGISVEYELIAGERRLRASRIAGLSQVPVVVRSGEESSKVKLEIAIIENVQREDLNAVDRARAFSRLVEEFNYTHGEVGRKIGKSREYVSNTLRLLGLPDDILQALAAKRISEGHTRPLLMLGSRPDEQMTLFKEIVYKNLNVREAELISRKIAYDKVRKKEYLMDPEIADIESKLTDQLGTRVQIEKKDFGGRIMIDYFSLDEVRHLLELVAREASGGALAAAGTAAAEETALPPEAAPIPEPAMDESDLYGVTNFTV